MIIILARAVQETKTPEKYIRIFSLSSAGDPGTSVNGSR